MNTIVKKWLKDKEYGFLENGSGPDIMVRKSDLIKCQFLNPGVNVEFECHTDKRGLIAKKVRLSHKVSNAEARCSIKKPAHIGVMT